MVSRWRWGVGGWESVSSESEQRLIELLIQENVVQAQYPSVETAGRSSQPSIVFDDWGSYERSPFDNQVIR